ncbi:hypothetical protein TRVA0_002S04192 [Trichomonascus vanleenenianus]|uniref:uncharacterized protein n=1 Tax=Trichomonascus vanleenenianus TaxID=2268995 RepID=UPI003ECABC92
MTDAIQRTLEFFTTDIRDSAPENVELPREDIVASGLLTKLSIEYNGDRVTYRSLIDPRIAYSVLLFRRRGGSEERATNELHNRIIYRLNKLIHWGCIRHVEWTFQSEQSILTASQVADLLQLLMDGAVSSRVRSLELHIGKDSGLYVLDMLRLAPDSPQVKLNFNLTGPLTKGSLPMSLSMLKLSGVIPTMIGRISHF